MTLTQDDLKAIAEAVRPVVKEEVNVLRAEMHDAFRKQSESLTRAIADAVKMMADNQKESIQEALDRIEELEDRVQRLEQAKQTTS